MRLGPDFSRFGHDLLLEKIFLVTRETECWTIFHLCPRRFWTVLLALIRGGTSKSRIFEKIYTLSQAS